MDILKNILSQEIIQRLGWTLVHFVWQAAAIGLLLAIVLRLLHKSSASLRYIIACMALALIVLMPAVTIKMLDVPVETFEPVKLVSVDLSKARAETQAVVEIPQVQSPPLQTVAAPKVPLKDKFVEAIEPSLPFIVVGWLVGVFGLSIWHLGGWAQLQRLRRKMVKQVSERVNLRLRHLTEQLGIKRAVEIAESALVQVPAVIGWLRPVILLPASALTGLSGEQLEAILAHELAHIKRCDYLVNMLQTAVEILGFYHPAVWWVSHKIRAERENCCDDLAVSVSGDRVGYARALTSLEEVRTGYSLAVAASGGGLFERIRRLLAKDSANQAKPSWLPSVIAIMLIASLLIPVCFALSSQHFGGIDKENEIKTVTLSVVDEYPSDKVDSMMLSLFDFSDEKIIDITVDLRGLSEREKGSRLLNKIFATKADISIGDDGGIVVFGPSTAEFKGTSLTDISKIGVEILAAHIRAEEKSRPSDFIDTSAFWNQWLSPGEVGAFLTEDGLVVAIQAGEFVPGSKKGQFKYFIVGHVDPQNLPEPKLIKKLVVRNKLMGVLEYPAYIKNVAKGLFEKIKNADYDYFLNSQNPEAWKKFAIVESYKTYKGYPELVRWICKTFRDNPIVSVELGEVAASQNDWPGIEYKLILKDGSTINGNLRFEYHFLDDNNGRWYGIHGIDWHLQDDPIKKPYFKTDVKIEVQNPQGNRKAREIYLPDEDYSPVILDLATGVLIEVPDVNSDELSSFLRKGKGDLVYASDDVSYSKGFVLLRDAAINRPIVRLESQGLNVYPFPQNLPEDILVTTKESNTYQITVLSADKEGCRLKYWLTQNSPLQVEDNESTARLRVEELRQRMEAARKLSDLGKAMLIYANDHDDKYPESLDDLLKDDLIDKAELDWFKENIEYIGHKVKLSDRPDAVTAYDKILLEKGEGTNVLYNDLHVQFVKPEKLKKLGIGTGEVESGGLAARRRKSPTKKPVQPSTDMSSPQIRTSAYVVTVPSDLPQLKELILDDKSETKRITYEKLEEFLKVISATPKVRQLSAPGIITNDGEAAELRTENGENFEFVELNVKNTVIDDSRTILLELDFLCMLSVGNRSSLRSKSIAEAVYPDHAISVVVDPSLDGQTVLLLVKPQILENQLPNTPPEQTQNSPELEQEDVNVLGFHVKDYNSYCSSELGVWNRPFQVLSLRPDDWWYAFDLDFNNKEDVEVKLSKLGFSTDVDPSVVFEKAGRGDICMPEPYVILMLRGSIIAPLTVPNPNYTREPLSSRITRMRIGDVMRQIIAYRSTHLASESQRVHVAPGEHYALLREDGLLAVMEIWKGFVAQFVPIGFVSVKEPARDLEAEKL